MRDRSPGDPDQTGGPDPEQVLRQALRAMAGGPKAPSRPDARPARWSDRTLILVIGLSALLTGLVLGLVSRWVY